jgi:hypothetical protein
MFPENYIQDDIEENETISTGKMFLYPLNKLSERMIYKVAPGSTRISTIAKGYNKKALLISR